MDLKKQNLISKIKQRFDEFKSNEQIIKEAVDMKWIEIQKNNFFHNNKDQIDVIKVNYLKTADRCDAIVERLQKWLVEGENQYQFSLRAHKKNLENFISLSHKKMEVEEKNWEKKLTEIVEEFEKDRLKTIKTFQKQVNEIRDINGAISHEYSIIRNELNKKYKNEIETLNSRNSEMKSALQSYLIEQISLVDTAMKQSNEDFKRKSEGKMQQFYQLFDEHKKRQKEMKLNEDTIIKKATEISHWRRKLKNNTRESKEENDRLRQEKENLSLHFRELKDIMAQFRINESKKLAEISVAFDDCIKILNNKLLLAEKILKYSEMTRKLETEREQVLPFPISITETNPDIERQMKQFKFQLKGDQKFVNESELFDKFYRRYNKVLLETLSLQKEKHELVERNSQLKSMLSKYVNGMGVNQDVLSNPNTLLIINQKTNASHIPNENNNIPIIDGDLTIKANKLQKY